jgi:hypothetical protein
MSFTSSLSRLFLKEKKMEPWLEVNSVNLTRLFLLDGWIEP